MLTRKSTLDWRDLAGWGSVALLVLQGCAPALPKMNAYAPIEKQPGFLGETYAQSGKAIDRADMISKLEEEPEADDELSGRGALAFFGTFFAGVGGGLVGYPLGRAAAGADDPPWILAGVGGGLILIGIPLAVMADNKVENAVDAHNRQLELSDVQPRAGSSPPQRPAAPKTSPSTQAPARAEQPDAPAANSDNADADADTDPDQAVQPGATPAAPPAAAPASQAPGAPAPSPSEPPPETTSPPGN